MTSIFGCFPPANNLIFQKTTGCLGGPLHPKKGNLEWFGPCAMTQYSDSFQVPEISRVAPSPTGPGLLYGLSLLNTMRSQRYRNILPHHPNDESGQSFARFSDLVVSTIFKELFNWILGKMILTNNPPSFVVEGDLTVATPLFQDIVAVRIINHLTGPKKNPTTKGLHAIDQCC